MRTCLALFVLVASSLACFAGEIRVGAAMQVKPNSIWFEEADQLARWQRLKKRADPKLLGSYQKKILSAREAWQFIYQQSVKILAYEPRINRVSVEMTTEGRLLGSKWWIDADALVQ
jgi:hypothetical protein